MKKIVSFGDSFIYGSELQNEGSGGWPGLIAKQLGYEYETCAIPGCGNDAIARQVLEYFQTNSREDTLAVINWTWALRWDFYIVGREEWTTIGPTCVPRKLEEKVDHNEAERIISFYNDYTGHSSVWEKWRSVNNIYSTQQYLDSIGVPSVETYIDSEVVIDECHCPDYIKALQQYTTPRLKTFEGVSFLDWSYKNGFEVTQPGLHPLEQAHEAAANLWKETYRNMLEN